MPSVEAGASVLSGAVTQNITPAGGGLSPSSAQSRSEEAASSASPDAGSFGTTFSPATSRSEFSITPDAGSFGITELSGACSYLGLLPGLTLSKFVMKAWNTNLLQWVFWVHSPTPDFVGSFSGYPVPDLLNIALIGVYL